MFPVTYVACEILFLQVHQVVIIPSLPRTASNKVMRRILRQQFAQLNQGPKLWVIELHVSDPGIKILIDHASLLSEASGKHILVVYNIFDSMNRIPCAICILVLFFNKLNLKVVHNPVSHSVIIILMMFILLFLEGSCLLFQFKKTSVTLSFFFLSIRNICYHLKGKKLPSIWSRK